MGQFIHKVLIKKTPDPLIGVACEPVYPLGSQHCTLRDSSSLKCRVCSQLHSAFVGFFYVSAISVCFWTSDFRLVIQVLLGPRMILNACARRPDLGLTSHPNDAALPHLVTHKATAAQCPGRGLNPGRCGESH